MQGIAQFKDTVYENYTLVYALPLSNHDNSSLMLIAGFYALLFISRHNTTLTYICILCVVDFLSMLPLPMTIIDQILGFWMFDTFACKLFRLLEHIGKIFSTFILVAFSIDRYCAVCHPLQMRMRNQRTVFILLGGMFLVTCGMLSPILFYAHSKEIIIHEKFDLTQKVITRMHLYKCVDDLGKGLFVVFTLYSFVLAYLMPLLFMIYFYYEMLIRLFKQAKAIKQTLGGRRGMEDKIPVGHIAIYTTPYWISVLYSLYEEFYQLSAANETPTFAFIYFMYGVHALPYINSASNFILYGLLNRQLHQTPERKYTRNGRPSHATTGRGECSELINLPSTYRGESSAKTSPPEPRTDLHAHLLSPAKTASPKRVPPLVTVDNGEQN
ncbi:unnamed protein product [Caenorhabditis auriculariae]|uniref:G-protein coupled receptors family 1 profile domain-containing protein n=1 Tax=Caenorhabditis auriculariae TaxID=2777116 RepID=A0A8S1H0D6_9PELO|nr:unnamed protein product [Caenorhabditis auriculariae]